MVSTLKKAICSSFFPNLLELLPCSNGFQLFVGCFPGSLSLKVHSFHSWLLSFSSLENSQLTAQNHFLTAKSRKVWKKEEQSTNPLNAKLQYILILIFFARLYC